MVVQSGVNEVCITHCLLLEGVLLFLGRLHIYVGVPDNLNSIPERERNQHKEDGDTCK